MTAGCGAPCPQPAFFMACTYGDLIRPGKSLGFLVTRFASSLHQQQVGRVPFKSMHFEPPLHSNDRAFRRLQCPDHEKCRQHQHDRRQGPERQASALDEGDDDGSHDMTGYENRDIGREIVSTLQRPVLLADRTLIDWFQVGAKELGSPTSGTFPPDTATYRLPG